MLSKESYNQPEIRCSFYYLPSFRKKILPLKQAATCGCGFHLSSYGFVLVFLGQVRVKVACKIFLIN